MHARADRAGSLYPVSKDDLEDINRRLRAADRDVSEFRAEIRDFRNATMASFNALREDFGDLRTHVDQGFAGMRSKLDATASGQQTIADLIQRLINNQDR